MSEPGETSQPSVTRETVRRMIVEFGCLEMSDEELDAVLPIVQAHSEMGRKFDGVDLSNVVSGRVLGLHPRGRRDAS